MFSVTVYKYAVLQVSCVLLKGLVVCTLNSSSFTILHFYVPAGRLLRLLFPPLHIRASFDNCGLKFRCPFYVSYCEFLHADLRNSFVSVVLCGS